jgi:RecJ-like exonuclease
MLHQPALPFLSADEQCPKCKGKGDVYYLHAKTPDVDVVGGKRVVCPVCEGAGNITVPIQRGTVAGSVTHNGTPPWR